MKQKNASQSRWQMSSINFFMFIASTITLFGGVLFFLSWHLSKVGSREDDIAVINFSGSKSYGDLRIVTVQNLFLDEINLYFDDSEAGTFLTDIQPFEKSKIKVMDGDVFFCTEMMSMETLATLTIRENIDNYYLQPLNQSPKPRNKAVKYKLNSKQLSRPHPQVVILNQHTTAMAIKFKSLSSRQLNFWFDDGGAGILEGHLSMGQETTTNAYIGHNFYFTLPNDKSVVIGRFKVTSDEVLYLVRDAEFPAEGDILARTEKELKYCAEYLKKTGIHWRHYFGPTGPRPPPSLYMWPADKIGQVHSVISSEGIYTYIYIFICIYMHIYI
jgi:hypothetical protein